MDILTKILRVLWIPAYRNCALVHRVAAATEHDAILKDLALDTVVDIGANRGQFALCIRRLFPAARIVSFEPLKKPAAKSAAVFSGDRNVVLHNKAIAAESGEASMHVSRWDVSSSLLPIAQAQHDNFPFPEESAIESVGTVRLADCMTATDLTGISLLKLDVQGFELTALRGCEELLHKFRYVYVESSFIELYVGQALAADIIAYLQSNGLKLICVANLSFGRSPKPIQADFLFVRG